MISGRGGEKRGGEKRGEMVGRESDMDGDAGDKGDVEGRIGELVEGTLALGIVTNHLLHQAEWLCERMCRLEEGGSGNCGGDVSRRRGHHKAVGVGSATSTTTHIVTNTNTKNTITGATATTAWARSGSATASPSSSPSRRRTPALKMAATASSKSPSSSPSKRHQTPSPGSRASRPASAPLQRSSPGKKLEAVASRELNISVDSVDAQNWVAAKEEVSDCTVAVDGGVDVVGQEEGARKEVDPGARSSIESKDEAAGELANNNDDGDGCDCGDDDDDDGDDMVALSPAIARQDHAVHLGDSGPGSQEQVHLGHQEGAKSAQDGAEERRCESRSEALAPDHQLGRDQADQSSSLAAHRPGVAAADVADQGKVEEERWACVDLDVDSKTLERALMWMLDTTSSKRAERAARGDGGAEEAEDATSSALAHHSLRGMDQEEALSLLLFADFLQCEGLIKVG